MCDIQGPFREGVARIFDRACDPTPQHSRSEPRSRARLHALWHKAHEPPPPQRATHEQLRPAARDHGASARSPAARAHTSPSPAAQAHTEASRRYAAQVGTFGCVSTVSAQLVTIPELLNLSVPRRPCGSTGGTAGFAGVPRIGWDRLRRWPEVIFSMHSFNTPSHTMPTHSPTAAALAHSRRPCPQRPPSPTAAALAHHCACL